MKAIVQRGYGSPDDLVLEEVAPPVAGEDEVLVRVRATSLHPDVWHVVRGRPYVLRLMGAGFSRPRNPIPGTDMAGVVESVGGRVTSLRPGDEVFGETIRSHQWTNGGAFAEYVAARPEWLAVKPPNVSFEAAAAVPTAGFIALMNLRGGRLVRPGQRVLVNGAGGGVGAVALQLAKALGARVTAVDGPSKASLLRSLGADQVVDYTREDFTQAGIRYDFIFDVPGNHPFRACRRALEPGGKYVLIGHEGFGASGKRVLGLLPRFLALIVRSFFVDQLRLGMASIPTRADAMAILREQLAAGRLTPVVDRTYPLSEIRAAFRRLIDGSSRGRIILTV